MIRALVFVAFFSGLLQTQPALALSGKALVCDGFSGPGLVYHQFSGLFAKYGESKKLSRNQIESISELLNKGCKDSVAASKSTPLLISRLVDLCREGCGGTFGTCFDSCELAADVSYGQDVGFRTAEALFQSADETHKY